VANLTATIGQESPGAQPATLPPAPATLEETGLGRELLAQLVLKHLLTSADCSGMELARRLGLQFSALSPVLDYLRRMQHCEIFGGPIGGPSYQYRILDAGRQRALASLEQSRYVGAAPVPLDVYRSYVRSQSGIPPVSPARVRSAFAHLVLSDRVLDQIGVAVTAGHSMFVYGPPGTGKSVIAHGVRNLMAGEIAIPRALDVEGHIVTVFDPASHEELRSPAADTSLLNAPAGDARWVRCRRPLISAGGELTLRSLDLVHTALGYYTAPMQMLANGGVLVIDDFGRQHVSPRDLLNRWIVPLESRLDYLTLASGRKFEIPFTAMIVFATNVRPSDLVDEAFLRRIQNKIHAESPTPEQFATIFEQCCRDRGVEFDPSLPPRLIGECLRPRGIALRGCQPRDLIGLALAHAAYAGHSRTLTHDLLETACRSYFVDDRSQGGC
jgi:hypothetical protein